MHAEGRVVFQVARYLETVADIRTTVAFVNFAAIKSENASPNDGEDYDTPD